MPCYPGRSDHNNSGHGVKTKDTWRRFVNGGVLMGNVASLVRMSRRNYEAARQAAAEKAGARDSVDIDDLLRREDDQWWLGNWAVSNDTRAAAAVLDRYAAVVAVVSGKELSNCVSITAARFFLLCILTQLTDGIPDNAARSGRPERNMGGCVCPKSLGEKRAVGSAVAGRDRRRGAAAASQSTAHTCDGAHPKPEEQRQDSTVLLALGGAACGPPRGHLQWP